ncbi:MAG: hypothetical protein ABID54_08770 [Pseudomonadota bacterium]
MQDEKHIEIGTIQEYLEGRLEGARLLEVESHLGLCTKCKKMLANYTRVSEILEKWSAPTHGIAYRNADTKRVVKIRSEANKMKARLLMNQFDALTKRKSPYLLAMLGRTRERLRDLFETAFTYPFPRFSSVFGEYQGLLLSPFGKLRFPIVFEWRPYKEADQYHISIEGVDWIVRTSKTKVVADEHSLTIEHGKEYMWTIKAMRGKEIIAQENGFFSLANETECMELLSLEKHIHDIPENSDRLLLFGGVLEFKEFYTEAIEKYRLAYELAPFPGIAYRIAYCYDRLQLEDLREHWNRMIPEEI